jgi:carboxyl-terminal processing protease
VRKGVEDPFDVKPARDILRVNPVRTREQGDVAYIKISSFNEQTNGELVSAIESAKKSIGHKLKGYVIDLRNNPGGLLDQAILVSSDFLNAGTIVLIKGRNNDETTGATAHPGDITDGKRIVVLINGGSASASEIVAGALQDHKRATVIGTHSFGMGSAQTTISLGVNGAIRLTTARYCRPSGHLIDEGIEPDVVVEEEIPDRLSAGKAADESRAEADLRKQDIDDDSAEMGETGSSGYVAATPETDAQLQYALGLLSGRLIQPAPGRDKKPAATFRLSPGPQGAQGSRTVTQLVAPSGGPASATEWEREHRFPRG